MRLIISRVRAGDRLACLARRPGVGLLRIVERRPAAHDAAKGDRRQNDVNDPDSGIYGSGGITVGGGNGQSGRQ